MMYGKIAVRVAAVGLFLWLGFLFLAGPTVEFSGTDGVDDLVVRCSPVTYYIGFDYTSSSLDTTDGSHLTFETVTGKPQAVGSASLVQTYDAINMYCDRARTSRAAMIGLLAVPTSILTVLAIRRTPTAGDPAVGENRLRPVP